MKQILAILLALSILLCFVACGQNAPEVSEVEVLSEPISSTTVEIESVEPPSSFLQVDSSFVADESTVTENASYSDDVSSEELTSEAMQEEKEKFYAFVDSLQTDSIGKIHVGASAGPYVQMLDTSDPKIIQGWIEIVNSIKIESVQAYMSRDGGSGPNLDFYDQDGNLCGRCIIVDYFLQFNGGSMELVMGEYDDNKAKRLMRDMGFDGIHTGMVLPYPEDVTTEVLQNAPAEFYSFIDSLQAENIGQIRLLESQDKSASDPEMIQKWLELFSSIKISSAQSFGGYNTTSGKNFYIQDSYGNQIGSFAIQKNIIIFDLNNVDQLTQLVIEEIDNELLKQLMQEMGFYADSIDR